MDKLLPIFFLFAPILAIAGAIWFRKKNLLFPVATRSYGNRFIQNRLRPLSFFRSPSPLAGLSAMASVFIFKTKSLLHRSASGVLNGDFLKKGRLMTVHRRLPWITLLSLWGVLMASASFGQSLQWSQFVGHNNSTVLSSSSAFAIERSSTGFLYVLNSGRKPLVSPVFPTTDLQYFGTGGLDRPYVSLSKYSPDGSQLLWTRVFQNTTNITPMGLALNAAGEPLMLFATSSANSAFITADAWQPTADVSDGGFVAVLSKFDANGNRTYGTYVGPTGGGLNIFRSANNAGVYFSTLFSAPDGTTYLTFRVSKIGAQTGIMPTTATAFQSDITPSTSTSAVMVMIFKPDNSLQYSSYFSGTGNNFHNATMSKTGDLYVQMSGVVTAPPVPATAAYSINTSSIIMRFNKTGTIVASTYQTPEVVSNGNNTINMGTITTNPATGDVISFHYFQGFVRVYDANLTTRKSFTTPFGLSSNGIGIGSKIAIDDKGRLHVLLSATTSGLHTTTGVLQAAAKTNSTDGAYYGIIDCNFKKLVYGTYLSDQNADGSTITSIPNDFVLDGCNAYIVGQATAIGFPITPTAYNDNGTGTVSGYRITPTNSATGVAQGFMTKFNYPVMKANTNVLTAPAITNFCADAGVLPIDGTTTTYITPTIIGNADANPLSPPIHYQWQIAGSATGPWTDIPDSDVEDLSPEAPATSGTYYYRRLVRQTPFEFGTCAPACDLTDTSNVISLSFSTNKTHTTNLSDKTYAFCKTGTLSVSTAITPSADGAQAPYTYKLTTLSNLTAVAQGQSGTVTAAPFTIDLTLSDEGKYLLQVTDSRGCTSFDTLTAEFLKQDAGSRIQFTCGAASIKLGPASPAGEYVNYPTNTFSWSPATGLDNPNLAAPTLSILPAVGASKDYYLTLNGCVVDTVTVTNQSVTPLPSLPDISRCQGDTATLGAGIVSQAGVTYEWAPGLGLTSTSKMNPILTTLSAPVGVNVTTYYLKAQNGTSGCVQYTSQKVTVYRTPNQSFQIKQCMSNGCSTTLPLGASNIGTTSEPGISYSWKAIIKPGTATTGMPTAADVIAGLTNPTGAMTDFALANPTLGKTTGTYQVWLIRTSVNAANPACVRQDTAFYDYCSCGSGGSICALALGALPSIACGGPTNKIGPIQYASGGTYVWTRLDGTPINNELFDPLTKAALTPGGPHPNQVIANPSGLVAVSYRLTLINSGADTCRIDIKVFPGAIGKPNVNYSSPQAVCQGTPYKITGPAANPGLTYLWSPANALVSLADTANALPTVKGLSASSSMYVTVTDPSTGCFVQDTVSLFVSPVTVIAGDDATFCSAGATVNIGGGPALSGYTYQWTAVPATGVTFGNSTSAQTTATLPATAAGSKITLYLTATNGQTSANCSLKDSVIYTSAAAPTVTIPGTNTLCAGGELVIGPVTPSGLTYAWSGPGIVGSATGSSISVNAVGTYTVVASQGSCSASKSVTVSLATAPTVTLNPTVLCTGPTTIGVNNTPDADWSYSWDNLTGLKSYDPDFSNITVEPTVTTTYTLTATHVSGCVLTFPVVVTASAYTAQLPSSYKFCEGGSSTLALNTAPSGATYAWTASPTGAAAYLSSTSAAQPTVNLTTAPAGTYTYTVTVTYGSGCQSTATTTVRIGKKISNVAGFDAQICKGSCTTIGITAVAGVSYEWSASPADPTLTGIYVADPTVCPTVTTTYTVKYFNESGCVFTDEVVVKVLPTPTLTVKDVVACGPVTLDLATAIVATTGTTKTYWLNASATIAATNPVNTPGTYYIKSADAVCSVIEPVKVTFVDLPTGSLQATYSCATQKGILQISSATAGARYDYSTGSTYTGSKTFATASIIGGGGILSASLPTPPVGGQSYTVRLFGPDSTCTQDITVTLNNLCPFGSLGDFVWKDTNDNGIQDLPGEKGVPGVIVQLLNSTTKAVLKTDTTDAAGMYGFTNLESGSYIVKIVLSSLPDTCQISPKQDISTGGGNDTNDSDFNPATGESPVVVINTAATGIAKDNPTIDAALFVPCVKPAAGADIAVCQLGGAVNLPDANALQTWSAWSQNPAPASIDPTTGVVNGLTATGDYFFILTYKTQAVCSDTVKITVKAKPVTTDVTGGNAICNTIGVVKLVANLSGGVWTQLGSLPSVAVITGDSAKSLTAVGTYQFIYTLNGCADTVLVETRNCAKGSLGDFVWKDTNNNGIQDETTPNGGGVAGVQIELYKNGSLFAKDTTDATGKYLFSNLDAGTYKIKVLSASLPAGCEISSVKDAPSDDAKDSDVDKITGESGNYVIDPLDPTKKDILTVDAALVVPCVKSKVALVGTPACSADVQTYSLTFSVTNKLGIVKVDKGTLTGSNPYTVTGIPSGATLRITDSLSAVCKSDTLITGPNCNCNPTVPTLITPSLTACIGDTFPTLKATVTGLATVEWFATATSTTVLSTGLSYKPAGTLTAAGATFYAQARSTDPSCPTAISTSRVMATVNAQDCTKEVDLALKKSINTKIAKLGDLLTYTIKVWNESNVNATGVEVTDSIATTVQFQAGSFTASRGSAVISGNVIKWTIGNIAAAGVPAAGVPAAGDTVTLTYRVKATQEGIHFNTAEISKTNEKDVDSTPGNGKEDEDDIDRQCFTVPIKLCPINKVEVNVSAKYTNVQWFKNGGSTPVASGNAVLLTDVGTYTFTATNQTCPASGCCPIIIEADTNCCPEDICIPFTIKQTKKGKK